MAVKQAKLETTMKWRGQYLILSVGVLLTVLLIMAIIYYWEEMADVDSLVHRYGYLGAFGVSVLGGLTVIPFPSLVAIFTMGHVLNPLYLGLVSGIGEALGGITVYLTGAGGGAIWSKFRSRQQIIYPQPNASKNNPTSVQAKLHSRWQAIYDRLAGLIRRRRGFWLIFISSALVISPFYLAGLAAGTLQLGLKRFFLVSWAGKTVKGLTVAYAGHWGFYFLLKWMGG